MIERISATLLRRGVEDVTLEWNGIGFKIFMPQSLISRLPEPGATITLYTYLMVRDDLLCMYGFLQPEERVMFETLLGVAGIGPKAAMGVIGFLPPNRFYTAIVNEEIKALTTIPGIGPKSARRIVLELKEKISRAHPGLEEETVHAGSENPWEQTLEALLALGYVPQEVMPAVEAVRQDCAGKDIRQEEALRLVLKRLGGNR